MVAQFIVGIGMHEHVKRSAIERKPTYDAVMGRATPRTSAAGLSA
jgi:hypothetical protein